MSYPLRLPEPLNSQARARAQAIGISFNALVCVAMDYYLRSGQSLYKPSGTDGQPDAGQSSQPKPSAGLAAPGQAKQPPGHPTDSEIVQHLAMQRSQTATDRKRLRQQIRASLKP
ncbi:MAG: hypothetical protein ACKVIH_05305 [Burkholderiales bacterium]